ncbi:hypothetical protein [Micromonospora sp. NPDC005305]|uniref:hypothetical protein n=1 Tax=Micromonospora sp. NPDC005305 TaxID=3156875 RepID=UPI0033BC55DD
MAAPVTVKDLRADQVSRLEQTVTTLSAKLNGLRDEQAAAEAEEKSTGIDLAALQAAASTLQQKLAAATMGADRHKIELDLDDNLLAQRPLAIRHAAAQEAAATKDLEVKRVTAANEKAKGDTARAAAELVQAKQDAAAANEWRIALTTKVVETVTKAGSPAVTVLTAAMTERLTTLLGGATLFHLVEARVADGLNTIEERQQAVMRAAAAVNATAAARSKVDGAVAQTGDDYNRARSAVAAAQDAPADFAAALLVLQKVVAWPAPTTAVQARIDKRGKAATHSRAAANEHAVRDALVSARSARGALAAITGPKKALNPAYNPATDDSVNAEREAAAAAEATLGEATAALTPSLVKILDKWEVAVPPDMMTLAVQALQAADTVKRLATLTDPHKLANDLTTAEAAYAEALDTQLTTQLHQDAAAEDLRARRDEAAAIPDGGDLRVPALPRPSESP